jgi:hypothetical protein
MVSRQRATVLVLDDLTTDVLDKTARQHRAWGWSF